MPRHKAEANNIMQIVFKRLLRALLDQFFRMKIGKKLNFEYGKSSTDFKKNR